MTVEVDVDVDVDVAFPLRHFGLADLKSTTSRAEAVFSNKAQEPMPSKPPSATGTRRRPVERSARKLTTTERGFGWQWQKLRLVILTEEPLCRFCREKGLYVAAEEVDHIDGDSHNNDRDNLRPLCRECHLQRTARDQAFGKHQWRPDWLRPSTIPLVIVCGAPASGKSALVQQQAGDRDLVIDLDVIASTMARSSLHGWDRANGCHRPSVPATRCWAISEGRRRAGLAPG